MVDAFIEKQSDLMAMVKALDTSDEKVEEVNSYLVEALSKFMGATNFLYVMIDAMVELQMIEDDPDREDLEEELDKIIVTITEAEKDLNKYIAESEEALDTWESMLNEHLEQ